MAKGNPRNPELERSWRSRLESQRRSGLSVRDYCAKHRLREPSFYAWRRIIADRDQAERVAATAAAQHPTHQPQPAFLPVTVVATSTPADAPIDIRLRSGQRLRVRSGCDRQLLADLITLLEGKPC